MKRYIFISILLLLLIGVFAYVKAASLTANPQAGQGGSNVTTDAYVQYGVNNSTWATIYGGPGNFVNGIAFNAYIGMDSGTASGWQYIRRGLLTFDTSSIPSNATITGATLSLYGQSKSDFLSITPDINIYSSSQVTANQAASTDYANCGSVAFSDTSVTYANWSTTSYNDFILNATGIAALVKNGVTKLCVRNANYDAANIEPTNTVGGFASLISWLTADNGSNVPKLTITYTLPSGSPQVQIRSGTVRVKSGQIRIQ